MAVGSDDWEGEMKMSDFAGCSPRIYTEGGVGFIQTRASVSGPEYGLGKGTERAGSDVLGLT